MKRILGLLLAGTMILALADCGKTDSSNSADDAEANHTAQAEQTEGGSNMLVAYFSLAGEQYGVHAGIY